MTTLELRTKLHNAIDSAPVNVLYEFLDFIQSKQNSSEDEERLKKFADKIFEEDDNLLRRLAQ